ncbi:hypothetical protein P7G87_00430 [Enterococcus asini]|uniref:hypothetical protein n=1 Tax=Enterococcus asini TaxID=57732 RepID=UPI00288ED033|nr:hypothetical protein [Enterococcus asini]MDT2783153.1 hypothetical protein [Enterococcus asini]
MKVYKKLYQKNEEGLFYEVFELPEGMDVPNGDYTTVAPPASLKYPKWDFDYGTGWVEDKDSVLADLSAENATLKERLELSEAALIELATLYYSEGA